MREFEVDCEAVSDRIAESDEVGVSVSREAVKATVDVASLE